MAINKAILPPIIIPANLFQEFDRGGEIIVDIPEPWGMEPDQLIGWECAQFSGFATIITVLPGGKALIAKDS